MMTQMYFVLFFRFFIMAPTRKRFRKITQCLMNLLALDHFYSSANSPIFLVNGRFQSIFCGRAVMKNCQIEKNKVPLIMQPKSNGDVIFSDQTLYIFIKLAQMLCSNCQVFHKPTKTAPSLLITCCNNELIFEGAFLKTLMDGLRSLMNRAKNEIKIS